MPKRLHVKKTDTTELSKMWGDIIVLPGDLYIRCDSKGNINWEKAPVYKSHELVGRDNVVLIK